MPRYETRRQDGRGRSVEDYLISQEYLPSKSLSIVIWAARRNSIDNTSSKKFSRRRAYGKSRPDNALELGLTSLSSLGRPLHVFRDAIGPFGLNLLHEPPSPLFDVIFVHGLRGGLRKTWSKKRHHSYFWPKEWLPKDIEFKRARIHSFGYNSDWGNAKESILDVHQFGNSLLQEIANSPDIRRDDKAYILANQKPSMKPLVPRIKGILFLATPHRGSDSAELLSRILGAAIPYGTKPFVSDLKRNSPNLEAINRQFGQYAGGLKLISFYETEKTRIGFTSRLIVPKDSAVLGYPNERELSLKATHRTICKFDSPLDPNFVIFKSELATLTRAIT
ncbi:hypothetical protein FQN54_001873 [Arachnomyces sp. PD_36]|nr:hypothetical protein FQN54_001873 [Arachnomyces sp. PD_36]